MFCHNRTNWKKLNLTFFLRIMYCRWRGRPLYSTLSSSTSRVSVTTCADNNAVFSDKKVSFTFPPLTPLFQDRLKNGEMLCDILLHSSVAHLNFSGEKIVHLLIVFHSNILKVSFNVFFLLHFPYSFFFSFFPLPFFPLSLSPPSLPFEHTVTITVTVT